MKKTKILLVGALLLGVPSVALSLSTQQENATVVRAATTSSTTINISSGTTINDGWKVSDTEKLSNSNEYFKLYGGAYIENTDYITIDCKKEVILTIGTGTFGNTNAENKKIKFDILNRNGDLMGSTKIISPTSNKNVIYTSTYVFNEEYSTNNIQEVKFRISSSDSSTASTTARYYSMSLSYYIEELSLINKIKNIETKTKLKFDYTKTTKENTFVSSTFDFANMGLLDKKVVSEFNDNNFNVLFDKSDGNTAPIYYKKGTGIRTYANNTISISSKNVINNVKLILDKGGNSNTITIDKGEIKTNTTIEKSIVNINSNELIIKVNGTTGHIRIQKLIINERSDEDIASYTNFSNLQLQYQYSFDVSSYIDEVQEIGMFVTDDANFEFNTDGIYDDELTFESQVSKDDGCTGLRFINSSKKETYTIGINLGNEIEGAILTTFRVGTYVKTNNKYYFSTKTSEYNLETMLEKYNTMELEGEGNAVIASFLAYVKTL